MNKETAFWGAVGAIAIPVFEFMYGAGEAVMIAVIALAFFIGMDWITGSRAAKKDKSYLSKYGIDGVFRTFFMLLLPAGGHLLDLLFNLPGILFGVLVAGLLYHVINSMVANAIRAGWGDWLPLAALETLLKWVGSEMDKKIQRAADRGGNITSIDSSDADANR
ncbi:MAG: phage holin family protein [Candidatus Pristimantibacillus lignocellulolyticus]|uniref:Phage holin family protein n=1 Tax=Candidatus Pristimantibacillus lignocellulolyticus TaxID=2994561 RepID=A0A9J6ZEW6_9BACL|nr:MAG: phage holin family protein [Candidatus Pristimantibacillus lignocellulolyticus]